MKKILFISFYWPPSGKASLHFPLKMIQYLDLKGYKSTVLTVKEDSFSAKDDTFNKCIPDGLQVIKTDFFDPFVFYKKFLGKGKDTALFASEVMSTTEGGLKHKISLWIRMNLFIPDARIGWYKYGVKAGAEFIKKNKVDVIITNGPPHSVHLIGVKLSKMFNIPLIPILIDPWVDIASYKNQKRNYFAVLLDNYLEKKTLKQAKQAIFVTKSMRQYFIDKYNFVKSKANQLYWGYNEEDFEFLQETDKKTKDEKILLHAGNMYEYQNPVNFWKTIKKRIDSGVNLKLKFIGSIAPNIKKDIINNGLENHCIFLGFLSYSDVIKEICSADYLLACTHEERHVPGKLFEYMRAQKPIIIFGEKNNEVNELITKANLGKYYSFDSYAEDFFEIADSFIPNNNEIFIHDRKSIALNLAKIIDNC